MVATPLFFKKGNYFWTTAPSWSWLWQCWYTWMHDIWFFIWWLLFILSKIYVL